MKKDAKADTGLKDVSNEVLSELTRRVEDIDNNRMEYASGLTVRMPGSDRQRRQNQINRRPP